MWISKCKNRILEKTLLDHLKTTGLTELAEKEAFEPIVKGYTKSGSYFLNTKFYLGFNNKENSLEPMVIFFKKMLEYIYKNYASY